MKDHIIDLISKKSPKSEILFLVIRGSNAYGTNTKTSDIDYSGVFVQPLDDILGNKYIEQINDDNNDIVIYELRRFLELLQKNNPTVLELLNTPDDCILYKNNLFNKIIDNKDKFLTKSCSKSFGGYAIQQIKKAYSQNKKQNWEKEKIERKTISDFIYVIENDKTIEWSKWIKTNNINPNKCGLVKIPNSNCIYSVFYDKSDNNLKYRGIENNTQKNSSNSLKLSSIPKGETPICYIYYNKDHYSQHCKEYNSYQKWLKERNLNRWINVKNFDQKIDGKNMMHCKRLLTMAKEIASGKGIIVRRPDSEELLKIRRGEVDLKTLLDEMELEIKKIDKMFEESNLPNHVDDNLINNLIIEIRKKIYNI